MTSLNEVARARLDVIAMRELLIADLHGQPGRNWISMDHDGLRRLMHEAYKAGRDSRTET